MWKCGGDAAWGLSVKQGVEFGDQGFPGEGGSWRRETGLQAQVQT